MTQGKFISFEGIDGSGISTQADLLRNSLLAEGRECYLTKEPTDGPAGAMIRLALAKRLSYGSVRAAGLDQVTLAMLFGADRMDHLTTDILPKIEQGVNVIVDRYYLSSFAYQGLDIDLGWLRTLNHFARVPDLTIIVDTPAQIAVKRMQRQRWHVELYEDADKLEQVRQRYRSIARDLAFEEDRIAVVDGSGTVQAVHDTVVQIVKDTLWKTTGRKTASPLLDQLSLHE